MSKKVFASALVAIALGLNLAAFAGSSPKLAIKGYDPVAYFTVSKATEGSKAFEYVWNAQTWRFKSKENLELFKKTPEKYAPQYDANCAWAVAHNYTAPVDPKAWEIVNGKLYLNYNMEVRAKWLEKKIENIASADKNWPALAERAKADK